MCDVAVVDYGMGNLRSVAKAIEHVAPGFSVHVSADPGVIRQAGRVVFPGQGAMPDCMRELDARGLREAVIAAAAAKPFLGICVGQQMLFRHSEEGDVDGIGAFAGEVVRFGAALRAEDGQILKVPHMGWNAVYQCGEHPLWRGIEQGSRFYFVHSYYVVPAEPELIAAKTEYGDWFTSAVVRDNIFAVQFHPEKSAHAGLALLANFVNWVP